MSPESPEKCGDSPCEAVVDFSDDAISLLQEFWKEPGVVELLQKCLNDPDDKQLEDEWLKKPQEFKKSIGKIRLIIFL